MRQAMTNIIPQAGPGFCGHSAAAVPHLGMIDKKHAKPAGESFSSRKAQKRSLSRKAVSCVTTWRMGETFRRGDPLFTIITHTTSFGFGKKQEIATEDGIAYKFAPTTSIARAY